MGIRVSGILLATFLLSSFLASSAGTPWGVATPGGTPDGDPVDLLGGDASEEATASPPSPAPLTGDVLLPHDTHGGGPSFASPEIAAGPEPAYLDTSRFLMGSVAYALILPASNGSIDANQEDWTTAEINNVDNEVQAGVTSWASQEPNAFLTFSYDASSPRVVNTSYEPITHPQSNETLWVSEVMAQMGYTNGSNIDRVRAFDNDLRTSMGTDWAFTVFVVDDTNDADKKFSDGSFGYAYLGGPHIVMTYGNDGWGIARMNNVTAHEVGHIFWATDEYDQGPTSGLDAGFDDERGGYLNIQEIWLSGCVMDVNNVNCVSDAAPPALSGSRGTTGQVGWRDTDGDGVFDILDVPPETTLNPFSPDPTNDTTPTYTGSATVVAFSAVVGTSVTINTLADVEYRVDGGSWASATPDDGAFDNATETFAFTLATLAEGNHTVEARAKVVVATPSPATVYDASPGTDLLQVDVTQATSVVAPLSPYTRGTVFTVAVTALEAPATVEKVELFSRKDGGPWTSSGNDTTSPFSFSFATAGVGVGDGFYEFYSVAYDIAGNVETAPSTPDAFTTVDTLAPLSSHTVSGTPGAPPWYLTTVSLTLSAADETSGVASTQYRLNGGAWQPYTSPVPVAGEGLHIFEYVSTDLAGNDETVRSVQFGVDLAFPDLAINTPGEEAFVIDTAVRVAWSVSDSGSGLASCSLAVDGGLPFSVGSATTHVLGNLPDGAHRVQVACTDEAGRSREEAVAFTFMTTNVVRMTPLGGSWLQLFIAGVILLLIVLALLRRRKRRRGRKAP